MILFIKQILCSHQFRLVEKEYLGEKTRYHNSQGIYCGEHQTDIFFISKKCTKCGKEETEILEA